METAVKSRFDIRLPIKQKKLFERAASLGDFRNLTEFVVFATQEKAIKIIEKHNLILASEKDKEIFFNAIMNPAEPNETLKKAASRFKEALVNK